MVPLGYNNAVFFMPVGGLWRGGSELNENADANQTVGVSRHAIAWKVALIPAIMFLLPLMLDVQLSAPYAQITSVYYFFGTLELVPYMRATAYDDYWILLTIHIPYLTLTALSIITLIAVSRAKIRVLDAQVMLLVLIMLWILYWVIGSRSGRWFFIGMPFTPLVTLMIMDRGVKNRLSATDIK